MAMDGLPKGVSPSGRVPEQLLQVAPILKWRRRRNREEFAKKGSYLGFPPRGVNIGEGGIEGTHRAVRRVPGAAQGGAARPWLPGGGPFPLDSYLDSSLDHYPGTSQTNALPFDILSTHAMDERDHKSNT